MSIILDFEDYYDVPNDTQYNLTPYVVDPKTLNCETKLLDPAAAVTLCVLLSAIFVLAVPGNLLVAWVIGTSRQRLTPSDVYLIHLTLADGLMALTVPFWAVALLHGWLFGDFLCKALNLVFEANFYTSILFLAGISVDRYLAIVRSNESPSSRQRLCSRLLCAAVWMLGSALALPALFNDATRIDPDSRRFVCTENFDLGSAVSWRLATRLFRHVFGFALPLVVMVFCYGVTVRRLMRTTGFRKHRAMKVIIAVVTAFLLCWTPYHVTLMVDSLMRAELIVGRCGLRRTVSTAMDVTSAMALLHSCINPVLYAFVGEKFRSRLSALLHRRVRPDRSTSSRFSRSTSNTSEGAVF